MAMVINTVLPVTGLHAIIRKENPMTTLHFPEVKHLA